MKNLLIRNLKLRKWTIAIYTVLLVASPLQLVLDYHTNLAKVLYSTLGMILVAISVLDSGHVFRFNSKLGHKHAYHFFASLPVSKLSLLNANYLTVIIFTLIGAGILSYMVQQIMIFQRMQLILISHCLSHILQLIYLQSQYVLRNTLNKSHNIFLSL